MLTTRPVTGLAADIDLFVVGIKSVVHRVVALFDVGAVALRTAGVPIEEAAGPVQGVTCRHILVGIKVVPPLPAFVCGAAVPCDGQRL